MLVTAAVPSHGHAAVLFIFRFMIFIAADYCATLYCRRRCRHYAAIIYYALYLPPLRHFSLPAATILPPLKLIFARRYALCNIRCLLRLCRVYSRMPQRVPRRVLSASAYS